MALDISAAVDCTESGAGLASQLLEEAPLAGRCTGRLEPTAAGGFKGVAEPDGGSNGFFATLTAGTLGVAEATDIPWSGVAMLATNGTAAESDLPPAVLTSPVVSMAFRFATTFRADVLVVSPYLLHLREA